MSGERRDRPRPMTCPSRDLPDQIDVRAQAMLATSAASAPHPGRSRHWWRPVRFVTHTRFRLRLSSARGASTAPTAPSE